MLRNHSLSYLLVVLELGPLINGSTQSGFPEFYPIWLNISKEIGRKFRLLYFALDTSSDKFGRTMIKK
jgi:hypothetical protein